MTSVEVNTALVIRSKFSKDEIELIRKKVAPRASEEEFNLFLYQAAAYGLNPLLNEMWCIKYSESAPASIFVSFSGLLKKVAQSGEFNGFREKVEWTDEENVIPKWVEVEAYRKGMDHPITFRAYLKTFMRYKRDGEPTEAWKTMPYVMLRKVAIVNALRQAFPDVIGALYIPEEMPEQGPQIPEREISDKEMSRNKENEEKSTFNLTEKEADLLKYIEYNEAMDEYELKEFIDNGKFDSLRKLMQKMGYEYDKSKKRFRRGHYDPVLKQFITESRSEGVKA